MRPFSGFVVLGLALGSGLAHAATPVRVELPSDVTPRPFASTPTQLFFRVSRADEPDRLWQSGGTPATTHPVWNGEGDELAHPTALTTAGDWLYFTASVVDADAADVALFRTDGAGVERVADMPARRAFVADARVFFTVPEGGAESLWVTGDAGATRTGIVLAEGASAIAYGTRLLFAGTGDHGIEPWQTDGTLQGTSQLADLAAGAADSQPAAFAVVGAAATFFSSSAATGITLWRTDGSAVGTTEVTAWPTDGATRGAAGYARRLYFRARMSGAAWAMWSSDGTKAGTAALALLDDDMLDGPMLGAGASFFFSGRYRGGAALFATGGTAASTVAVVAHGVDALTALGDRVYFPIDDTHLGGTNGTTAGTGILELPADVGHVEGAAGIFAVAAQNLYFTSMGEDGDVRLWALPLPTQTAPVLDAGAPTVADAGVTEDAAATEEDDGCSCKNNKLLSPFLGLFMFAFAKRRNKN